MDEIKLYAEKLRRMYGLPASSDDIEPEPESKSSVNRKLVDALNRSRGLEQQEPERDAYRDPSQRLWDTISFLNSAPVRAVTKGEYGYGDLVGMVAPDAGRDISQSEADFVLANRGWLEPVAQAGEAAIGIPALGSMGAVPGQMLRSVREAIPGLTSNKSLYSKSATLYNPPVKSQRPFEADYPHGGPADETGRLLTDIEGRPLGARHTAGRSRLGGNDEAVSPEGIGAIAEAIAGTRPAAVAPRLLRGQAGRLTRIKNPDTGFPKYVIDVSNALAPTQGVRVTGHEVGHLIDEVAGQIPTSGLHKELSQVYDTLLSGREKARNLTSPSHIGYSAAEAPREMMAEAIRAYMADPNYLKTVGPKTAAAIRKAVNSNPRLRDIIQFNSLIAAIGASGATSGDEEQ